MVKYTQEKHKAHKDCAVCAQERRRGGGRGEAREPEMCAHVFHAAGALKRRSKEPLNGRGAHHQSALHALPFPFFFFFFFRRTRAPAEPPSLPHMMSYTQLKIWDPIFSLLYLLLPLSSRHLSRGSIPVVTPSQTHIGG